MNKFFVVINGGNSDNWSCKIWDDIKDEAKICLNPIKTDNKVLRLLHKLHFSNKVNNIINIPFKQIWTKLLSISESEFSENDTIYIIFQSNIKFPAKYLKYIKSKYKCYIILYLPDTVRKLGIANNLKQFNAYIENNYIDLCFSFDKKDCKEFGTNLFDVYSSQNLYNRNINSDLFYVGNCRNKMRLEKLLNIFKYLENKILCNFYIFGVKSDKMEYKNNIKYNQYLSYNEVIDNVLASNCILELVNENQTGNTLRFKEAICFNKKLLTDNSNVKKSKYYNRNYIKVFNNFNQIDFKWIKEEVDVEYNYLGDFSPRNLLNIIKEKIN